MAEQEVAWLTEAITTAFNQGHATNGLPPPRVAWAAAAPPYPEQHYTAAPSYAEYDTAPSYTQQHTAAPTYHNQHTSAPPRSAAAPSTSRPNTSSQLAPQKRPASANPAQKTSQAAQPSSSAAAAAAAAAVASAPPVNARARSEYKQWVEQWRLLLKREQLAAMDVRQGVGDWLIGSRDMKEDEASRQRALEQLKHKLQEELWTIRGAVDTVKLQLVQVKPGPSYVAELSREIERVDTHLSHFKGWQASSSAVLVEQECQLQEEIEAAVFKIEDEMAAAARTSSSSHQPNSTAAAKGWGGAAHSQRSFSPGPGEKGAQSQAQSSGYGHVRGGGDCSSLAPEVIEFEEFLEKHGETGGWHPDDHAEFVNILKACGGDYTHTVKLILENGIGYSQRDVILHSRWHMDYMDLMVRKRMALAAWRAKRDQQRSKVQAQAALLESDTAAQAQAEQEAAKNRETEWEREQAVRREIVKSWKERQEAQRRHAAEVAAQKQLAAQLQREAERAERQQMNKMKLELHRQAKEAKEREAAERRAAQAPTPAERMSLASLSPQQVASLAMRNAEMQRRHKQLISSKEAASQARSVRQSKILEKVHKEGERDPSRLLRPTSAHQRRVELNKADEHAPKDSGFILTTTHRAPAPLLYRAAAGG